MSRRHCACPFARTDPAPASSTSPANVAVEAKSIPGLSPQIRTHFVAGNKIAAIKRYREECGLGLKEAKDAVHQFDSSVCHGERPPLPRD